ncbi:MAG: 30S ribosomal protein S13 [Candidatus Woesearchaeota archaeon]
MEKRQFMDIVRINNTDILGKKQLLYGLIKIKGVKYSFANAVCRALNLNPRMKVGELTEEEIVKLNDAMKNPQKYGIPSWLFNRRRDPESGKDYHLTVNDWDFAVQRDITNQKKIKSYVGLRHARGLPVRGQKTKSNHRKSKIIRNRKIKTR